jgi:hypothetical protein
LTPSPILKVLSSIRQHQVQYLLMGGQACVLYGGAEFSRDTDLMIVADHANLQRLDVALRDLQADGIVVPPFEQRFLDMGLAVHFRCRRPDVANMRIDVMSRLRGVEEFSKLWDRRTTVEVGSDSIDLLSLPDLVQAKKTQHDKDWPMLTRLVEANFYANRDEPTEQQVEFWLRELRTPSLLCDVAERFPEETGRLSSGRSLLNFARVRDTTALTAALADEERGERAADVAYWQPLRRELERLRHAARTPQPPP